MKYKLTFNEFEERIKKIAKKIIMNKAIKNLYGIPRGGLIPAVRLSHLTGLPLTENPDYKETAIIDDCYDTGATFEKFKKFEHFFVIIDKEEEEISEWIDFWWEEK